MVNEIDRGWVYESNKKVTGLLVDLETEKLKEFVAHYTEDPDYAADSHGGMMAPSLNKFVEVYLKSPDRLSALQDVSADILKDRVSRPDDEIVKNYFSIEKTIMLCEGVDSDKAIPILAELAQRDSLSDKPKRDSGSRIQEEAIWNLAILLLNKSEDKKLEYKNIFEDRLVEKSSLNGAALSSLLILWPERKDELIARAKEINPVDLKAQIEIWQEHWNDIQKGWVHRRNKKTS